MLSKVAGVVAMLFVFSYVISSVVISIFFDSVGDPPATVQQVEPVSTEFSDLDPRVFNDDSLNPAVLIEIEQPDSGSVFSIGEEDIDNIDEGL